MFKKLICVVLVLSITACLFCVPVAAYNIGGTDCGNHDWDSGTSVGYDYQGFKFSSKNYMCKNDCPMCKYEVNIMGFTFDYINETPISPSNLGMLVLTWYKEHFGEPNSEGVSTVPGGGSFSHGGFGRDGSPAINTDGQLTLTLSPTLWDDNSSSIYWNDAGYYDHTLSELSIVNPTTFYKEYSTTQQVFLNSYYIFTAPCSGVYTFHYVKSSASYGYLSNQNEYGITDYISSNCSFFVPEISNTTIGKVYSGYSRLSYQTDKDISISLVQGQTGCLEFFYISSRSKFLSGTFNPVILTVVPAQSLSSNVNIYANGNKVNSDNTYYYDGYYCVYNGDSYTVYYLDDNNNATSSITYDSTTKVYYITIYNYTPPATATPAPTASPAPTSSPAPTATPNPSASPTATPVPTVKPTATPKPVSGYDDTNLLKLLNTWFQNIKDTLVNGFASITENFNVAIENLSINIQNFFIKNYPPGTPEPTPVPTESPGNITITKHPQSVTVNEGEEYRMECEATSGNDLVLTYEWQYSKDGGNTWQLCTDSTVPYVAAASAANSGCQFRCVVSDTEGNSVTSNVATLTVVSPSASPVPSEMPEPTVEPTPVPTEIPEGFEPWIYTVNGEKRTAGAANKVFNDTGYQDNASRVATTPIWLEPSTYNVDVPGGYLYTIMPYLDDGTSGTVTIWWNNPKTLTVTTGAYYVFDFKKGTQNAALIPAEVTVNLNDPTATPVPTVKPTATPKPTQPPSTGGDTINPLDWFGDLLKALGSAILSILKMLLKLLMGIISFLPWLIGLLLTLCPFLPTGFVPILVAGAVIVVILRIIKFILGR